MTERPETFECPVCLSNTAQRTKRGWSCVPTPVEHVGFGCGASGGFWNDETPFVAEAPRGWLGEAGDAQRAQVRADRAKRERE